MANKFQIEIQEPLEELEHRLARVRTAVIPIYYEVTLKRLVTMLDRYSF